VTESCEALGNTLTLGVIAISGLPVSGTPQVDRLSSCVTFVLDPILVPMPKHDARGRKATHNGSNKEDEKKEIRPDHITPAINIKVEILLSFAALTFFPPLNIQ